MLEDDQNDYEETITDYNGNTFENALYTLTGGGETYIYENLAIVQMERHLFFFPPAPPLENQDNQRATYTIFVNCNDLFAWGYADLEPIASQEELIALYKEWLRHPDWGPSIWACLKRGESPQAPVKKQMIEYGVWDARMEALPPNTTDRAVRNAIFDSHARLVAFSEPQNKETQEQ